MKLIGIQAVVASAGARWQCPAIKKRPPRVQIGLFEYAREYAGTLSA